MAAVLVIGCAGGEPDESEAISRPAAVPASYVATPAGWFDPACVIEVASGDRVDIDGSIRAPSGALRRAGRPCPSPHYDARGRVPVEETHGDFDEHEGHATPPPPTIAGYVEYLYAQPVGPLGSLRVYWTVPQPPPAPTGQTIYLFPGLEHRVVRDQLLQPVLGWNASGGPAGWSLSSWSYMVGNIHHTPFLSVASGTTVHGQLIGSNCQAPSLGGVCTNWAVEAWSQPGSAEILLTTTTEPMDFMYGLVLEVYGVDNCNKLPLTPSSTASMFTLLGTDGAPVATPAWTPFLVSGLSPQCSYAQSSTATTATVSWSIPPGVCTPGNSRLCCAYSQCSCRGAQTCSAAGQWDVCTGSVQGTGPCM